MEAHWRPVRYALCWTIANGRSNQGRIQEFWLGGGEDFFSKAWGLAALKPPVGQEQRPGGSAGGNAPEASEY